MLKNTTIFLVLIFGIQLSFAIDNKSNFSKQTYHEICQDLQNNIVKPGKKLNRKEKSVIKKYLKSKNIKSLNKRDLRFFESALKKHRFLIVNKKSKSKNNIIAWPKHSDKSSWFNVDKKIAQDSYYMLSIDLLSGVLKDKQRLSNVERKLIRNYIDVSDPKNMRSRDVKFFENAIKKHKHVVVNKSNKKRFLRSWPQKTKVGSWYRFDDSNIENNKKILPGKNNGKKKILPKPDKFKDKKRNQIK